jgi:hypothetical protein
MNVQIFKGKWNIGQVHTFICRPVRYCSGSFVSLCDAPLLIWSTNLRVIW